MFEKLANFEFKRNFVQAIGFYIAYISLFYLLLLLLSAVLFALELIFKFSLSYNQGYTLGLSISPYINFIYFISLYSIILFKKNLLYIKYLILGILGSFITIYFGLLWGALFFSFLTTISSSETNKI